ncbi:MAG TPA: hypothetical protein VMN36_19720 [Verrucomicrobiales bacterium]|nr:hypothetical protein [Verrucomicrobiales bacterium]
MKTKQSFLLIAMMLAAPSLGWAFDIPRYVHAASAFSEASADALKGKKALVFVRTNSSLQPT